MTAVVPERAVLTEPALVAEQTTPSTARVLREAAPLLVSVACLMAGNGLSSTLLGTRAGIEGFRPTVVGVVLAGFYLGFVAGSLVAPETILRVGHVRVFAGLASLGSAAILVHIITPSPITWFVLRAVSGMCISALYIVSETWLNGLATNRTRGVLFAAYMVVVSGSLLGGQVLFSLVDPAGFSAFVLASVLLSLAVVPVSLASFSAPIVPDPVPLPFGELVRTAPLAPFGGALCGFAGSAVLGGGVVYAAQAGFDRSATAALIGAALLGGALLQIPLGAWSDRVDRRFVIFAIAAVATAASLLVAWTGPDHRQVVIALTLVAGGTTFPLYALTNAHLNDWLDESLMVAGGARMVLINGVGAIGGPIVGAAAVGQVGPGALFVVLAVAYGAIAVFALARMAVRSAAPEGDRADFSPVAVGMGPTSSAFDAAPEDLYPPVDGTIDVGGRVLSYRVQGWEEADAVVLLGTPPSLSDPWIDVLPAMAWDGLRAITIWDPDRPGASMEPSDVLALLRELELPWASYVGAGSGRDLVRRLGTEHPDRTDAAVLLRLTDDEPDVTPERPVPGAYPVLEVGALDWADAETMADDIADALRYR